MSELSNLYQQTILRHNKSPYHYGRPETSDVVLEAYNPLCGDKYKIYLDVVEDRIDKAYFFGYGCAISKASTSVLVQRLEGKKLSAILELCQHFLESLVRENADIAEDEELAAFSAARQFPGRLKCASLSWDSLIEYLEISEE
ncbi:MAG: iron-sulfur cluster assembly scaffold protein [Saprospiraceae bacterium]|nr:MAG: iron-sulfur cluster assembly scaffold protein [Saprospiraceae bacterium]